MTFRECIAADLQKTFLNTAEFAEEHEIDGRKMPCMIDANELLERRGVVREGEHKDGLFRADRLIYVPSAEFGRLPAVGGVLTLDGETYTVREATDEAGLYAIYLEVNRSAW